MSEQALSRLFDFIAIYYYVVEQIMEVGLGEFEQIVVLAILRLGDTAYAVSIRDEIARCTDREPTPGALYTTLDRLEEKGLLTVRLGDPTPQRGGRARRYFKVNTKGLKAVARVQRDYRRLLDGIALPGVANA